jgi:hypothetical protein
VKAQIRMLFQTGIVKALPKEICAIRSFQLTNKRVAGRMKQTFKALDSVLRTNAEDGTKASLSHRCADIDQQVPELMGVSRAVLESVIFLSSGGFFVATGGCSLSEEALRRHLRGDAIHTGIAEHTHSAKGLDQGKERPKI